MKTTPLITAIALVAATTASANQCPRSEHSSITLPLTLPIAQIEDKLNQSVEQQISGQSANPLPNPMIDDVLTWTASRDTIRLTPIDTATLQLSTTIAGEVRIRGTIQIIRGDLGRILGDLNPMRINVSQSARLAADAAVNVGPMLTPEWSINPRASIASVDVTQAEARIAEIGRVSFRGQIQPEVTKRANALVAKLNRDLPNDETLRREATELWADLHQVVPVKSDVPGWIVVRPVELLASQLVVDAATGTLRIVLGACLETSGIVSEDEPQAPPIAPLPPLRLVPQVDEGAIVANLPVGARWSTLTDLSNAELDKTDIQWPPEDSEYTVSVSSVTLDGSADGTMTATLDLNVAAGFFSRILLGRSFTGTLSFEGTPQLKENEFSLASVRVTSESDALLQGLTWLAQGSLVSLVEEKVRFDVSEVLADGTKAATEALADLSADLQATGVNVTFGEPRLSLRLADPDESGLMITAKGVTSVSAEVSTIEP